MPLTLALSLREREPDTAGGPRCAQRGNLPHGARPNRPTCHSERSEESQMLDLGREVERSRFLTFVRNDRKGMRGVMTPVWRPAL